MMDASLSRIIELLAENERVEPAQFAALRGSALRAEEVESEQPESLAAHRAQWLDELRQIMRANQATRSWSDEFVQALVEMYRQAPAASPLQGAIMRLLAHSDSPTALAAFAALLTTSPPVRSADTLLALSALFQRTDYPTEPLFPALLAGLGNPELAAAILDFANWLTRQGRVSPHPASSRLQELTKLLGGLTEHLERLVEKPTEFSTSPQKLTTLVNESVSLVVSLCDALALIGDKSVTGRLHRAMGIAHRRVRLEAAAALARLDDPFGVTTLAELTTEPVVRTRALAYLDELGMTDKAPEQYRSPIARAEGELAAWLTQPTQFGAPPKSLTLVDERRMYWPGFVEPIDCYLFDFEYRLGERSFSSVAIVGPLMQALPIDLEDLPPSDIYALYAGWHAEHPEITQTSSQEITPMEQTHWAQTVARLTTEEYSDVKLELVGSFFGRPQWVATARHGNQAGIAIIDADRVQWFPTPTCARPPGPADFYNVYKGRELLATFNSGQQS